MFILAEVSVDNTYQRSSNLLLDLEPFYTNETLIRNPVKFTDLELVRLKKGKRVQSPLRLSYLFPGFFFFFFLPCRAALKVLCEKAQFANPWLNLNRAVMAIILVILGVELFWRCTETCSPPFRTSLCR